MSYDYFFFARPADGSPPKLETLGQDVVPLGSPDEVMKGIDAVFPALAWQPPQGAIRAWFGNGKCGQAEFLMSAETNGLVTSFKAAYIEREEVDALAAQMRLTVFDPQSGECYAP